VFATELSTKTPSDAGQPHGCLDSHRPDAYHGNAEILPFPELAKLARPQTRQGLETRQGLSNSPALKPGETLRHSGLQKKTRSPPRNLMQMLGKRIRRGLRVFFLPRSPPGGRHRCLFRKKLGTLPPRKPTHEDIHIVSGCCRPRNSAFIGAHLLNTRNTRAVARKTLGWTRRTLPRMSLFTPPRFHAISQHTRHDDCPVCEQRGPKKRIGRRSLICDCKYCEPPAPAPAGQQGDEQQLRSGMRPLRGRAAEAFFWTVRLCPPITKQIHQHCKIIAMTMIGGNACGTPVQFPFAICLLIALSHFS